MQPKASSVIVVGAGLAGFTAATQLRKLGHTGSITIVDSEMASYDRPPLSKALFDVDFSLEKLIFASAEQLQEQEIRTRFGARVADLNTDAGQLTLDSGEVLSADTIILAMGGRARQLPIPGSELPELTTLRTFADAMDLRDSVTAGTRVAVVGAGLIGAELASALQLQGAEVTLVDPAATPLVPAVGELIAAHLHSMHAQRGVRVFTGQTAAIESADGALRLILEGGATVLADRVVVGVGIVPNVELAEAAGIETDNGVLVDAQFRTSVPNVFAVGDVARRRGPDGVVHRREEHWEAAQLSGREAAHAILGLEAPARGASWFWSDRYGCHLEATGRMSGPGALVVRHAGEHPAVFLVDDGQLRGAAAIDDAQLVRAARRLIDLRIPVTEESLADPAVSLRTLLKAAR